MNTVAVMDGGLTKLMVFARSKTGLRNLPTFKFGNLDLDQVEDYIYLSGYMF